MSFNNSFANRSSSGLTRLHYRLNLRTRRVARIIIPSGGIAHNLVSVTDDVCVRKTPAMLSGERKAAYAEAETRLALQPVSRAVISNAEFVLSNAPQSSICAPFESAFAKAMADKIGFDWVCFGFVLGLYWLCIGFVLGLIGFELGLFLLA